MKRFVLLTIAFFSLTVPSFAQTAGIGGPGDAGIFTTTLSNGLRVVVVEDHAAPVVQTGMWYHFGSLDETAGKTGLAHALEHMNFRGTANISASGLDDIVAHLGAQMNAETTYDYTHFYFVLPADKLDIGLAIEADRMQHLSLAQSEWQVERGAVLNEFSGDESSPFYNLLELVRAAAYPREPNGRTPLGNRDDVERATASDIAHYYREWYAPNNATLVVAGDVQHANVFSRAQHYFAAIPRKNVPNHVATHPKAAVAHGTVVESSLPFPFAVVDLAYTIPGDTEPGEPSISTLATLIGNERSPFHQALVQTNVALAVEAQADTQVKGGLFNVFIVLNPGHTADEAQSIFQSTMDHALTNGFDPDLVLAAQRLTIAERLFSADSVAGSGDLAGYTYGIIGERIQDEDTRLAALTPADILNTAKTYLKTPTVIGHLRPDAAPPKGSSQKSDATASDDFSKRIPNGAIVEPAWVRASLQQQSTARSVLAPTMFTLPNGLKVIVQEKHDHATFALRGEIASSPAFAPPGKEGIIRLASAVADYGSATYPFAERHKEIDNLGAFVQTGASFSAHGFAKDFSSIARVVADGEEHPAFADPWFTLERDQLANSLQSEETISGVVVERTYLNQLLAPDDPALRRANSSTVSAITRDDLTNYARTYWRPDLTTIAVVGDVTPDQVRQTLTDAFGSWKADGTKPDPHLLPLPPPQRGHGYVGTDATQVFVRLGQPAIARSSSDYDTFLVLNQILGASGAYESRLWQEMRQKRGLVYSVSSSLSADRDRGDFRVEIGAAPNKVVEAVSFVRSELRRLQEHPVTSTELGEAKARLVSNALLDEASTDGQLDQILDIAVNGLPLNYYGTFNDRFARVTSDDVERIAKTYLQPDKLIEIYSGPQGPWSTQGI